MARQVLVEMFCDVCGERADSPGQTGDVHLGMGDVWYTLDLCEEHFEEATKFLDRFFVVGTLYRPERKTTPHAEKSKRSKDLDKVRTWARQNGIVVSERGRVASEVMHAYEVAMQGPPVGSLTEPTEPAAQNPQDLAAGAVPAPDTAQTVKLHETAFDGNGDDGNDMPGAAASMDEVKPTKTAKGKVKVAGTRNPDGRPVEP